MLDIAEKIIEQQKGNFDPGKSPIGLSLADFIINIAGRSLRYGQG